MASAVIIRSANPITPTTIKTTPTLPLPKISHFSPFKSLHHNRHHLQIQTQRPKRRTQISVFPRDDSGFPHPLEPEAKRTDFGFLLWASVLSVVWVVVFGAGSALAAGVASDSIRASGLGLRVAAGLRSSGWPDEAVVFVLAMLPVLELRGAIPVGYWMQLDPLRLTALSVLGNMVPIPFIVLYLKRFASFLACKSPSASHFLDLLFKRAREKAKPVEEFQWLGLMLFVAVPFPGTGAWTGAIIASILDMPFWPAFFANFFGVVVAGLLVNLLVNLGLKHAIVAFVVLFFVSTIMWSVLRKLKKTLNSS
ncbi:hypothetical protein QJS10_CPB21g00236 [Acorus calamus]|uniref:Small multi-drug export protein n=1 Tax=Acorus calamus TaxID=4465 RepID=A0AAV9C5A0_ACOCL|nr:hypothetical protein QJS10_CPB21g00236 [Acorus calamus]